MITAADILEMPKLEKIRAMELIWNDLSSNDSDIVSPQWHAAALQDTVDRDEEPIDWSAAKEMLRAKT
jgi:hypothetical protein